MSGTVDYSVIIPVYFNGDCLPALSDTVISKVIETQLPKKGEFIFVDDGSKDDSLEQLLLLKKKFPNQIKVVKLCRNFGQVHAIAAGFSISQGSCVLTISADGQEPPEIVNQMLDAHFKEGFEVVICARKERDESWYRIVTSRIFYSLVKKLAFSQLPSGGFDIFLLSKRALEVFQRNTDANPFTQGQVLWMGFPHKSIEYNRLSRIAGRSRWTFAKKLTYLIDGVLAYSYLPIRWMSLVGLTLACIGFIYAFIIVLSFLFWGNAIKGWAPIVILILTIGGFQTLMLGIIGEYVWRTLAQVRKRDAFIIDRIYE